MAVYTNLNDEQISDFLKLYRIGKLISFTGITEGIENSNFHLKTTSGEFILTIFEKRVNKKDLPFFINVMKHLSKKKFFCPRPISDAKDNYLQELRGKPAIIVNYLQGKSKTKITIEDCYKVGSKIALMHIKTKDFFSERENSLSINGCQNLIKKCIVSIPNDILNNIHSKIDKLITEMNEHLSQKNQGEILRDGYKVVIVGEPNVGKSSLLNLLADRDIAIVSDQAGTTRDALECRLNIAGFPVLITDTAGLRESDNEIEMKGIEVTKKKIQESQLVIEMFDDPKKIHSNNTSLKVLNKSDLHNGCLLYTSPSPRDS